MKKLLLLIAIFAMTSVSQVFAQSSLDAFFTFDNPNAYDGSYHGNPWFAADTLTSADPDLNPQRVSFEYDADRGSNVANFTSMGGNLYIPNHKGWSGSAPRSIALWVKNPDLTVGSVGVTLVSMGNKGASNKFVFAIDGSSNLRFEAEGGGLTTTSPVDFSDGKWHHVACVWNNQDNTGDGNINLSDVLLYFDGAQVQVGTHSQVVNTDPVNDIGIGQDIYNSPSNYRNFVGLMDDVMLVDGALSADDVAALASGSTGFNKEISADAQVIANNNTVTIKTMGENAQADFYSISGMLVKSVNASGSMTVTIDQAGLYIVAVRQGNNVTTKKILITK